jgi:hypothetical protein
MDFENIIVSHNGDGGKMENALSVTNNAVIARSAATKQFVTIKVYKQRVFGYRLLRSLRSSQ